MYLIRLVAVVKLQFDFLDSITKEEINALVEEHYNIRKHIAETAEKAGYRLSDSDFYDKFRKHIEKLEHDKFKYGGIKLVSTVDAGENLIKKHLAILKMIESENCGGNLNV